MTDEITKIAIFRNKEIRKTIHKNEWWFSVVDVVEALTDSVNPNDYWFKMKIRVKSDVGIELSTICRQLKLQTSDKKKRLTDCANTEGFFCIIQSIPSPRWHPIEEDMNGFYKLINEISTVLNGDIPKSSEDCNYCKYIRNSI